MEFEIFGGSNRGWAPKSSAEGTRMEATSASRWKIEVRQFGKGIKSPLWPWCLCPEAWNLKNSKLRLMGLGKAYKCVFSDTNCVVDFNTVICVKYENMALWCPKAISSALAK